MEIKELLLKAVQKFASDIHLTVGKEPVYRINGELFPQKEYAKLSPPILEEVAAQIIPKDKESILLEKGDVDFAYSLKAVGRFRVNIFKQRGMLSIALRIIKEELPSLTALKFPKIVGDFTRLSSGLVLITGPTGSGKSTTLAALMDKINSEQRMHIITLEDPIEYVHQHKLSIVNQREMGTDAQDFANGLRAALRQDPDVIMVGELRDLETISTAITAAETGHLVFGTLHTNGAVQTIDRIIDVFPAQQQIQIRTQLAETLRGIVSQQLLSRIDISGRVAALEILVATPAIRNLIRENKSFQIVTNLQTGSKYGMQTMEMSLRKLAAEGVIVLPE